MLCKVLSLIRLISNISNFIGTGGSEWNSGTGLYFKKKYDPMAARYKSDVKEFFERDDVSRLMPEKKQTITRSKVKKQKRLLSDTLSNLYEKFMGENTFSISFTVFCRLKPFWVRRPSITDGETCLCKLHENLQL